MWHHQLSLTADRARRGYTKRALPTTFLKIIPPVLKYCIYFQNIWVGIDGFFSLVTGLWLGSFMNQLARWPYGTALRDSLTGQPYGTALRTGLTGQHACH